MNLREVKVIALQMFYIHFADLCLISFKLSICYCSVFAEDEPS